MKKYGGINTNKSLDEIEEAVVYTKPPIHFTKLDIVMALFVTSIKLIPVVFIIMIVTWLILRGLSFIF